MCGINGIYFQKQNSFNSTEAISKMNQTISHRGPDDQGVFSEDNVTLGQTRLSIIDLSSAGHQPMTCNDERFTIVFNGEIYNFKEIRLELQRVKQGQHYKPYAFKTQTDTEVILAAYSRWGKDCVSKFNGMFAFAIWDNVEKSLFIVRDRLGIKPLYCHIDQQGNVVFSSEIRALLASGLVKRKISVNGVADYLQYQTVHAPDTIVENVKMLMPGHSITLKRGEEPTTECYWNMNSFIQQGKVNKSYEEVTKDVKQLLLNAVERRLIADVPFGAFLSGGIDSSAVVALMSKVSTDKVQTFSIVFDESEFSEAVYSRMVAQKYNTHHHEIRLTPGDFMNELPHALDAMDHPSGDGPNTYVVSKATKQA
jgi:asparagine synthase (glutamine-hydrolysing)